MARLGTIPFFKDPGIELGPYEPRCHLRRFDVWSPLNHADNRGEMFVSLHINGRELLLCRAIRVAPC